MEYIGLKSIREAYLEQLKDDGKTDKVIANNQKELTDPIYDGCEVHAESEPNIDKINEALSDITIDILALNKEIAAAGNNYNDLMTEINSRLDAVNEQLTAEEYRIKDMNIVCGNYDEFVSVKTLNYKYFKGSFGYDSNYVFFANPGGQSNQDLSIVSVEGNGYEGNQYVYKDGYPLKDTIDTSIRDNMIDSHISTAYEYSRLTANTSLSDYPEDVNFDREEALCTITLFCKNEFGTLRISSDIDSLVVQDILYSPDLGNTYTSAWNKPLAINDLTAIYNDSNYIYDSGIICFPSTNYLKVALKSGGVTEDAISFTKMDTTDAENPVEKIIDLPDVKRHIIRINDLNIISASYATGTKLESVELIGEPTESIAIFVNEYVPQHFVSGIDYLQYILTINGVEHKVVPINSNKEGVKVIRHVDGMSSFDNYAEYIQESIKSAKLSIIINTPDSSTTPYISNVKICYGKAADQS